MLRAEGGVGKREMERSAGSGSGGVLRKVTGAGCEDSGLEVGKGVGMESGRGAVDCGK